MQDQPSLPAGPSGSSPGDMNPGEMRRYSFQLIKRVMAEMGWKYKAYFPAYILISAIFLLPPLLLKFFTGETQRQPFDQVDLQAFLELLIVFGLGIALCLWLGVFVASLLGEWLRLAISVSLRKQVLDSLHQTRIEALDTAHRGDWLTRMTGDLRSCEGFLSDALPNQVQQGTLLLGSAGLFFFYTGWVALIPCAAALVLAWLNIAIQKRMAPALSEVRMKEGNIFQFLIESFEGLRTIRSFRGESIVARRMHEGLDSLYAASMRIIRRMGALMGVNELAGQLVITLCLCVAAWSLTSGSVTAADILFYPFYLNIFLGAAKALVADAYEWNRFFIEGGRLGAIFFDRGNLLPGDSDIPGELDELHELHSLEVTGLEIGYGDGPAVARDFSFRLKSREIVALMGPSGCGKSTFIEVLAGLRFARKGKFRLETSPAHGFELTRLPVTLSAYVEQRPYLFVGSFRENLTLGTDPDIADETIWETLRKVELEEVVRARGGIDEVLYDRGMNLSEGQRYRLALARALLTRRPVVLLDEPFAALDEKSIESVVRALHAERDRGAAIVLITHLLPAGLQSARVEHMQTTH